MAMSSPVNAIGTFYEEDGAPKLTAKLLDCLPSHTRSFASPSQMLMEIMSLRSVPQNWVLELWNAGGTSKGKLGDLPGDRKEWARILLCGPDDPKFPVRFSVFYERSGPVLAYCLAGSLMSYTFSSKAGVRFESPRQLIEVLCCVGLPGKEICSLTHRVYYVTKGQLRMLYLGMPEN